MMNISTFINMASKIPSPGQLERPGNLHEGR